MTTDKLETMLLGAVLLSLGSVYAYLAIRAIRNGDFTDLEKTGSFALLPHRTKKEDPPMFYLGIATRLAISAALMAPALAVMLCS